MGCTILDVCEVHIGDNVLLAPGCGSTTAHPVAVARIRVEFGSKPVRIGTTSGLAAAASSAPASP